MRLIKSFGVAFFFVLITVHAQAQVPGIISYQGRVTVGGTNFNGAGQFKFALVNGAGSTTYWSNGTSTVSIPVTKGYYSVLLGGSGMTPISYAVFDNSDVRLRVWFNGGSGLQQLSPDQRIGSVGYAMAAAGLHALNNGAKWDVGIGAGTGPAATGFTFTDGLVFSMNGTQCAVMGIPPDDVPTLYCPSLVADDVYGHSLDVRDSNWETVFYADSSGNMELSGNINAHGFIMTDDYLRAETIYANSFVGPWAGIHSNGSIFCTGLQVSGSLQVSGTKNFVQPHPSDLTKEIVYTCLEGPEAGTYVRGSAELVNGETVITLPDHFSMVTCTNGLTVQLTPRGTWLQLYAAAVSVNRVVVRETEGRSGKLDYLVQGVRIGHENTPVIRERKK